MQEYLSDTSPFTGLNEARISILQQQFGKNLFKDGSRTCLLQTIWEIIKEPMFIMLVVACSIYFILGERSEGILMGVAILFVTGISLYQEVRSSHALQALKQLTEPRVKVIREDTEKIILSEDLVPGDLMKLEEGNRIPADAVVVRANDMTVNEAILTGESIPVEKDTNENRDQLYQGTNINSGMCYATVTATGNNTRLGKLGISISQIENPKTPLQDQISRFVRIMAIFGVLAFILIWFTNYLNSKDAVQSLLLGLTLAMSAIPEEIPVAFSSFMALGSSQMSRLGIISRQPQTIENLGAVSVICLDKTGTITENKMQVRTLYDFKTDCLEDLAETKNLNNETLLLHARLASEKDPFDAMEKAIVESCGHYLISHTADKFKMVYEYALGGQPPMMTHVYLLDGKFLVTAKGAPERIFRICGLKGEQVNRLVNIVLQMASDGYRVLAVCSTSGFTGSFPVNQDDFNWELDGLIALYDPPKKNVQSVFQKLYQAGIQIKMVTGDYRETAINIARQTGMQDPDKSVSGDQIMELSKEELRKKAMEQNIFFRMFPEAKLKLVEALKANGQVVAMTGDGVNDAPALKSSDIGIAMGGRGTEMAKEAANLIITDDNLDNIAVAVLQGRKIFNNLKKAIRYIISIHIPIIFTASLPLLLGWKYPNIFTPIHIIFLELIMGPTCSIFFEREPPEENLMVKKPRSPKQNMFSADELLISIVQGLIITLGLLVQYYYYMVNNYPIEYTRTVVFTTLILCNIFLTFSNRSFEEPMTKTIRYKNNLVPYILTISILFLFSILFITPFRKIFQLTSIGSYSFAVCVLVSGLCTGWFELFKSWKKLRATVLPGRDPNRKY